MKPHLTYHGCPNWTTAGCACPDLPSQPEDSSARGVVVPMEPTDEMCKVGDLEILGGQMSYRVYRAMLSAAPQQNAAPVSERGACHWKADDDGVYWTTCGNAFTFIDAGPKENNMAYCCYCGGPLSER